MTPTMPAEKPIPFSERRRASRAQIIVPMFSVAVTEEIRAAAGAVADVVPTSPL